MHANIIDGGTRENRGTWMSEKSSGLINLIHLEAEKSSLTIKQIKDLLASLTTRSPIKRIIWIEEANLMTIPAQNALLKSLEEPPLNTTFYLTCDHASSLLSTIRSRSLIQHLDLNQTQDSALKYLPDIKAAMSATLGNRIQLAGLIPSDRQEALTYLDGLLQELNWTMTKTTQPKAQQLLVNIATNAYSTRQRLASNCSVGLTLQNFFLHLPKTKL